MTLPTPSLPTDRRIRDLRSGVTLIELMLVMALLAVGVALTFPSLRRFFEGRSLDSEATRLLALSRYGQSRAISEGIPMILWFDEDRRFYGLEAMAGYEDFDEKALEFSWKDDLELTVSAPLYPEGMSRGMRYPDLKGTRDRRLTGLPSARFLPDGFIAEPSPEYVELRHRSGAALWLVQATNRLSYELSDEPPFNRRR